MFSKIMGDIVTYEIAKAAKEKGFNWIHSDDIYYDPISGKLELTFNGYPETIDENKIAVPTQSVLAKWLRENKGLAIWCEPHQFSSASGWSYSILYRINGELIHYSRQNAGSVNLTYEEALDKALTEGLKLLK